MIVIMVCDSFVVNVKILIYLDQNLQYAEKKLYICIVFSRYIKQCLF